MGPRVLITGVNGFLGAQLARALSESGDAEEVIGVDTREPSEGLGDAEFVRADIRSPLIHRVLTSTGCAVVVHADLTSRQSSRGGRSAQKERNVIGTMQLLGACQRVDHVKKVIIRSSTAVYGQDPSDPSILTEDWSSRSHPTGYGKDIADAETYSRDFGRRRPDVTLTILRMANVVGPIAHTNITQLFELPMVPTALGYDPRLQLLHERDALETLRRSVVEDHPGVFNVAADGAMYLSQAIRIARRFPIPIVAPLGTAVGDLLRRTGLVDFPTDQIGLLLHGRVVDNARLKEVFGYEPEFSTLAAFRDFAASRLSTGGGKLGEWQRNLFGLFASRAPRPYVVRTRR